MKIYFPFLALTILSFWSCNPTQEKPLIEAIIASKDITQIRKAKQELQTEKSELDAQITLLSKAIENLAPNQKIPLVTITKVNQQEFKHYIELQGTVETKDNRVLTPEFAGNLSKIYVQEGQKVSKGQLIAEINDGGLKDQLSGLEVQKALAKTTFERQERLWNQQIGSEIQYLQAKTNYESIQNSIAQLEANLKKTKITAPFSGIIDDIITEEGTIVSPGMSQIAHIVSLKNMYVRANVPEKYLETIKKNTKVNVSLPVLSKSTESTIQKTSNYIQPSSRTFEIEIPLKNTDRILKPNLTARLKINDYTNKKALLIEQQLISENANGEQYIYLVTKNKKGQDIAKKQIITTGKTQGDFVEILTGLKANAILISEGARSIKEGQQIKIINP